MRIVIAVFVLCFGSIQEFDLHVENITSYLERPQINFSTNRVEACRRVSTLPSLVGHKVYDTLRSLLAPV